MNEVVGIGSAGCCEDLLVGGRFISVFDIVIDGTGKQPGVLQDHSDAGSELVGRLTTDIFAVNAQRSAPDLIKPLQQMDERGLSGSGAADDGDHLPFVHRHAEILQ